eukprot:m.65956 g.65956  ORF g.65956 m.65956 type:complete len:345 (+) comp11772_c0_seq1:100-1134(+)
MDVKKEVFKGEGRWKKELLFHLDKDKVMNFEREKMKAIKKDEYYDFLLKIPNELEEEIKKKKGIDNLSTELQQKIKSYNTRTLYKNVYDFIHPPTYEVGYYYQFKKNRLQKSKDEWCKSWAREQLSEKEWDNLEEYVDRYGSDLVKNAATWDKETKKNLWTGLCPVFKGFKQISKTHVQKLKDVLRKYPNIYDIRQENWSTIVHQAAYHDQERILEAIFDCHEEKANNILNSKLKHGVKPIHNTFLAGQVKGTTKESTKAVSETEKVAKGAIKARTFLFHRIHKDIEKTGWPIEEYLEWAEAYEKKGIHDLIYKTVKREYTSFTKKRKNYDAHEPDPKRINASK